MGKEKTTLINMRIPNSILKDFDDVVSKNNLIPSRTAMIINMMDKEITKAKKKYAVYDKQALLLSHKQQPTDF